MRYNLSHTHILGLLQVEMGDQYESFERELVWRMHKVKPIWAPIKRQPDDILDTIKILLVERSVSISAATKYVLDNLKSVNYVPSSSSSSLASTDSEKVKSKTSARSDPRSGQHGKVSKTNQNNKQSASTSTPTPSVDSKLSRTQTKKLVSLLRKEVNFACTVRGCRDCRFIANTVPLTRCNHTNPHPTGWFVHTGRKRSRAYHKNHDTNVFSDINGLVNPIVATNVRDLPREPLTTYHEPRMTVDAPVQRSAPTTTSSHTADDDSANVRTGSSSSSLRKEPIYYPFSQLTLPEGDHLFSKGELQRARQRYRDKSGNGSRSSSISSRGKRGRY